MATTAVAPSAAAASGDADSGMSKYYASKIGELSAVSCVRAKGLRRMLTLACFVRLSLAFGALPIFGCGDTRRCAVGLVRSALHELFIVEIPTLVENVCLFSAWGGGCVVVVYQPHDTKKTCACSFILFICLSLGVVCDQITHSMYALFPYIRLPPHHPIDCTRENC